MREALVWLLLGAAVAALILHLLGDVKARFSENVSNADNAAGWIALAVLVAMLPLVGFAGYLWHFAARVRATERYPLPGQAVIRDTIIHEGEAALRLAASFRVLAIILCVLALVIPLPISAETTVARRGDAGPRDGRLCARAVRGEGLGL